MTKREALTSIRALNMTARTTGYGDIRVTFREGSEEWRERVAYYATTWQDAADTAMCMRRGHVAERDER